MSLAENGKRRRRPSGISPGYMRAFWSRIEPLETRRLFADIAIAAGDVAGLVTAIGVANANGEADVISLAAGSTYTFATAIDSSFGASALPAISSEIRIEGNGATLKRDSTVASLRLARIVAGGDLSLANLTLRDFRIVGGDGATFQETASEAGGGGGAGMGGVFFNEGTLKIVGSTLTANAAVGGKGGDGGIIQLAPTPSGGGGGGGIGGNGGAGALGGGGGGSIGAGGNATDGNGAPGGSGGSGGQPGDNAASTSDLGGAAPGAGGGGGAASAPGGAGGHGGGGGGGGANGHGGAGGFGGGGGAGGTLGTGGIGGFGGGGGGGGDGALGADGGFEAGAGSHGLIEDIDRPGGGAGGGGAGFGGAIFNNEGTVTIVNSTFTANAAQGGAGGTAANGDDQQDKASPGSGIGGAIFSRNGSLTIANSTLSANTVSVNRGRNLYVLSDGAGKTASARLTNSIVGQQDNSITDVDALDYNEGNVPTFAGSANNLIRRTDLVGLGVLGSGDPKLGPLLIQGGPTATMALLSGSPALNAGNNSLIPGGTTNDQRGAGFPRIVGAQVDVGAFEAAAASTPKVSIADVSLAEGNAGLKSFTFTLTRSSGTGSASVNWATADGATPGAIANAGFDYQAAGGTVHFAAGQLTRTVTVKVIGDTNIESDQRFVVNLSNPTNLVIDDGRGTGTILNDDVPPPTLSISDASVTEGNSGSKTVQFTISLDRKINQPVTFKYATAPGSAAAGIDFVAKAGTVTIPTFAKSVIVTVAVNGDLLVEPSETFSVNLSALTVAVIGDGNGVGTIVNDDTPAIRISNAPSVIEGNSGTRLMNFTVTLDRASNTAVSVKFATADGTATTALNDYQATSGTITFAAGQTSRTISVVINGDTIKGVNETVFVNLTSPIGAIIDDGQGVGTIMNDD